MNLSSDTVTYSYWGIVFLNIFVSLILGFAVKDYEIKQRARKYAFNMLIIPLVVFFCFFIGEESSLMVLIFTFFGLFCLSFMWAFKETNDLMMLYLFLFAFVIALIIAHFAMGFDVL